MKVTIDEIVKSLRHDGPFARMDIADSIEAHGIEQPSIDALIAEGMVLVAYQRKFHGTDAGIFANTKGLREEMTTEPFASEYEYIPLYAAAKVKP